MLKFKLMIMLLLIERINEEEIVFCFFLILGKILDLKRVVKIKILVLREFVKLLDSKIV